MVDTEILKTVEDANVQMVGPEGTARFQASPGQVSLAKVSQLQRLKRLV